MLGEGDIRRIVSRIADGYGPLLVGTFGSYAIGTAREGSDLDIFVIKRTPQPRSARVHHVRRLLFGVLHPLDIHVFEPHEFEATVYEPLSFTWVIARQAQIWHAHREAETQLPSLRERIHATAVGLER
jgi:predicted nucleotidyltransferase